ncbi:MAG TPA: rod shape-determining protein [Lachnospiraceae bacterium]|nr:rod shape-determining protein [Lachnospiraceae bacterium]
MIINNVFGVDLGTSAVKIYSLHKNQTTTEKNMIAVRNQNQVIAVGNDAFEMFEKAPDCITVDCPVKNGNIADVAEVEIVLQTLLRRADHHIGHAPVIYFSAPVNMSEIEKRAYFAVSHAGNLKNPKVYLVDRAICDAIALGIPLTKTKGSMIVNIGAQNTEVSVISNEQVIISKNINIGGQQLNNAICDEIRRQDNLLVGKRTARRLKAVLATFSEQKEEARKVVGLNTLSGLPREGIVSSALVCQAVEMQVREIASEIKTFLERTPPQIGKCIYAEGIYLTGGTARIPAIDRYLKKMIGVEINLSSYYELCTIKGLEELIKHKPLQRWAYTIRKKK